MFSLDFKKMFSASLYLNKGRKHTLPSKTSSKFESPKNLIRGVVITFADRAYFKFTWFFRFIKKPFFTKRLPFESTAEKVLK
ncbi:MAG: hypothetical protein IJF52_05560 [Clostridia bacterium]|nr:hypothetical protein [Clostridia bacterium]